jgi:cyclopropane fatty-acyl-phospholipid synthase-like methyltransferase
LPWTPIRVEPICFVRIFKTIKIYHHYSRVPSSRISGKSNRGVWVLDFGCGWAFTFAAILTAMYPSGRKRSNHVRDPPQCFDVIHSVIVLQHKMPHLQQVYLEQFGDLLTPETGQAWLQIRSLTLEKQNCDLTGSIENKFQNNKILPSLGVMRMHYTSSQCLQHIFEQRHCHVVLQDVGTSYLAEAGNKHYQSIIFHVTKK